MAVNSERFGQSPHGTGRIIVRAYHSWGAEATHIKPCIPSTDSVTGDVRMPDWRSRSDILILRNRTFAILLTLLHDAGDGLLAVDVETDILGIHGSLLGTRFFWRSRNDHVLHSVNLSLGGSSFIAYAGGLGAEPLKQKRVRTNRMSPINVLGSGRRSGCARR